MESLTSSVSIDACYSTGEIWFVTGAQLLYGGKAVEAVDAHSRRIVDEMNKSGSLPVRIVYRGTVNSADEIAAAMRDASSSPQCLGVITWMHTFSPAKMWIRGLQILDKPLLHLHTQFDREIPWSQIDMDYMNLNQSAHGDREFGHIVSRMRKPRKIVVGHWTDAKVCERIAVWMRVCAAWSDARSMKIVRFGDNMNNVAVTDGDRVEAELVLGYHVDDCPVGELAAAVTKVSDAEINEMVNTYAANYDFAPDAAPNGAKHGQVREAARIEVAMRRVLSSLGAKAFTTHFDVLHGLNQLPGLASQRLMFDGFGFGAEGDWKTAALLRTMKVMAYKTAGGTSFMEDYVNHFSADGSGILQAHMLEVCPSVAAAARPRVEVHHLGIGGKADPARLVFTAHAGEGIAATVVDMGGRFRVICNAVECIAPPEELPKLPVARGFWRPLPSLETSAHAWILAGGTHHTAFSFSLTPEFMTDYAEIAGVELLTIDKGTSIENFKRDIRIGEIYYLLNRALQR
ncbi:MAG: L-arabinose isomerase [Thermoguttaceae bacterium]